MNRIGSTWIGALVIGAATVVAVLGGLTAAQDAPKAADGAKVRLGVYDSRAIAVGARNSEAFRKSVGDLVRARDEARAKGDPKRVAELERRGQNLQTLRHLQAFSNGPVDDLLATVADRLPAIARDARVVAITAKPDWHGDDVELVDVTDALVATFHPDAATLKIVADIKNHAPMPLLDVLDLKE